MANQSLKRRLKSPLVARKIFSLFEPENKVLRFQALFVLSLITWLHWICFSQGLAGPTRATPPTLNHPSLKLNSLCFSLSLPKSLSLSLSLSRKCTHLVSSLSLWRWRETGYACMCVHESVCERERERETETGRERERDRDRETEG